MEEKLSREILELLERILPKKVVTNAKTCVSFCPIYARHGVLTWWIGEHGSLACSAGSVEEYDEKAPGDR